MTEASKPNETTPYYLFVLRDELYKKIEKNSRYSMRAFARHLKIHPSAMSRILAGKQALSTLSAVSVIKTIGLDDETSRLFLQSVVVEYGEAKSHHLGQAIQAADLGVRPLVVEEKTYAVIAKLLTLALRELMLTHEFRSDPKWIADRLNVADSEIQECLQALMKAGLVEKKENKLLPKNRHVTTVNRKQSTATRLNLQKEILNRALHSLENDPFERRGHYGMTMAINIDRIQEANKKTLKFMEELCDFLETGERKEVYQLSVQLFPLTRQVQ